MTAQAAALELIENPNMTTTAEIDRDLADTLPDDQLSALEISHEIKDLNLQTLAALVLAFRDAKSSHDKAAAHAEMCDFAQAVRDAA